MYLLWKMEILLQIQKDIVGFWRKHKLYLPLWKDVSDTSKGINGITIELKGVLVMNPFDSK